MQLGSISISISNDGGTGSSDLVDGVPVLLSIQENNHGRVGDIVGTHVIDSHSVRRGDKFVLLAEKVTLMEKGRRHQMRHANNSVRDTRIVLGLLENVIASSVEIDKGNVLTLLAFPSFALAISSRYSLTSSQDSRRKRY
jgi:hypothetical protein